MTGTRLQIAVYPEIGPDGSARLTAEMRKNARAQAENMLGPCREMDIAFTMATGMSIVNITYASGEADGECKVSVFADVGGKVTVLEKGVDDGGEICVGGTCR